MLILTYLWFGFKKSMIPLSNAVGCDCQSPCPETSENQETQVHYIKLHISQRQQQGIG